MLGAGSGFTVLRAALDPALANPEPSTGTQHPEPSTENRRFACTRARHDVLRLLSQPETEGGQLRARPGGGRADVANSPETWEKVLAEAAVPRDAAAAQPPARQRTPTTRLSAWLETELDRAAAANPNPGRPADLHRLNRAEYANAVRDLLGVQVDGTLILPPDEQAHGFDTNADALSVVPALLDRYLTAAAKISRLAVGDPTLRPAFERYTAVRNNSNERTWLWQTDRLGEEFPLGSRGGIAARHYFPVDGEYVLKARLDKTYTGMVRGLNVPNEIEFRVDGKRVGQFTLGGPELSAAAARASSPDYADAGNPLFTADDGLEVRVPLKAGLHEVTVTAVKSDAAKPEGLGPDRIPIWGHDYDGDIRAPLVFSVLLIGGPYNGQVPQESLSRRRIFVCSPATRPRRNGVRDEDSVDAGAARVSPAGDEGRRPDAARVLQGRARRRQTSKPASASALERLLVSPDFLFRIEADPAEREAGRGLSRLRTSSWRRACRFFCGAASRTTSCSTWRFAGSCAMRRCSMQQVRRMLADPRARTALVQNFFSQWLQMRNVWLLTPDASRKYPVVRRQPAHGVRQGNRAVPREPAAGRPQHGRAADRELHVPQRTARPALRDSRCLRQPLPPRDAGRSKSLGPARQGQRPVGDVVSAPHLADDSRQVAAREYSRGAGAASAAGCEHHARRGEDGQNHVGARDARAAPRESRVRQLPRQHGSARLQPREFRFDRPVAHERRRVADRRVGRAAGWHESRWPCGAARRAAAAERPVREGRHQQAAAVRARPRARLSRRAGDSRDRARRRRRRPPLVVDDSRDCEEHPVPDAARCGSCDRKEPRKRRRHRRRGWGPAAIKRIKS